MDTSISSAETLMSSADDSLPVPIRCNKRNIFVLTYRASADLSPEILHTLTAKSHDSCCVGDVRHSLIHTWNPKRISWMEGAISAWNDKANETKIIFESFEAFNKTPEDHPTVKTIRESQQRGEGLTWTCDRLIRKLEIDMVPQGDIGEKRKRAATTPFALENIHKPHKLNKRDMDAAKFLAKQSYGVNNNSLERVIAALQATLDAKNETIAVMANAMRMLD
jgi:hypothetical protein